MVSEWCVDAERQGIDIFNNFKHKEDYVSTVQWMMGIWRLKGTRKHVEISICPIYRKKKLGHILRRNETKMWREEILDKRFWNIDSGVGTTKTEECKNNEMWQKLALYLNKYREKWERMMKKNECDNMLNSH
jgi:hypothetical protein